MVHTSDCDDVVCDVGGVGSDEDDWAVDRFGEGDFTCDREILEALDCDVDSVIDVGLDRIGTGFLL